MPRNSRNEPQRRMIKVCQHDSESDHITSHNTYTCDGPNVGERYCTCGAQSTKSHKVRVPVWCRGPFNRTKFV